MNGTSFSGARAADKLSACPSNHFSNAAGQAVLANHEESSLGLFQLTEVELGDLKKVGKDIAELLGQRLKTEVILKGKTLIVPDVVNSKHLGVKDLKLQVKHVLHHLHLSEDYRVLAEHQKIRVVKVEEKVRHVEKEGTAPAPAQSLPYLFP